LVFAGNQFVQGQIEVSTGNNKFTRQMNPKNTAQPFSVLWRGDILGYSTAVFRLNGAKAYLTQL
jgi:hypothetical protein